MKNFIKLFLIFITFFLSLNVSAQEILQTKTDNIINSAVIVNNHIDDEASIASANNITFEITANKRHERFNSQSNNTKASLSATLTLLFLKHNHNKFLSNKQKQTPINHNDTICIRAP